MATAPKVELILARDGNGKTRPIARNLLQILRNHQDWIGVLRHNDLTETDEYHASDGHDPLGYGAGVRPVTDAVLFDVRCWMDSAIDYSRPPAKDLVFDAVEAVSRKQSYHPVRDYLAPLAATWDGKERIAHWLTDYCGADGSDYVQAVAAKTLIAAAKRAFEPGCKVDTMLVLVGRQGVRKSTAIKVLGGDWTCDTPIDIGSKDAYEAIRGAWLVEIAELAGMGGKDVERLKAFFSSPVDRYRPPYARKTITQPRSSTFFGTTNTRDFLKDSTGARRFWCVDVGEIDIEGLMEIRDQLWAEAAMRALEGAPHWLTEDEAELAIAAAEAFMHIDPWEDTIQRHLTGGQLDRVHTSTIYDWLEVPEKDRHTGTAQRIVRIMCDRLGWERPPETLLIGGVRARGYRQPVGGLHGVTQSPDRAAPQDDTDLPQWGN